MIFYERETYYHYIFFELKYRVVLAVFSNFCTFVILPKFVVFGDRQTNQAGFYFVKCIFLLCTLYFSYNVYITIIYLWKKHKNQKRVFKICDEMRGVK